LKRKFVHNIIQEIKQRWSPRAFSLEKIPEEDIQAIIEAACYAPSCFNEQPWRFLIASEESELNMMRDLLTEKNQRWAKKAPVLILVIAHRYFAYNGKENRWHQFDSGTAWGYLSLEAQKRGLITHGMGGFKNQKTRDSLNISEEYEIIAVIAIGKLGNKDELEEEFKKEEYPSTRRPIKETAWRLTQFLD
jgi:nitroreductase